jgi:hypothetical protein
MGEMTPSITVLRIVLSYCGPLSFRNIGTPFLPVLLALTVLLESLLLLAQVLVVVELDHNVPTEVA